MPGLKQSSTETQRGREGSSRCTSTLRAPDTVRTSPSSRAHEMERSRKSLTISILSFAQTEIGYRVKRTESMLDSSEGRIAGHLDAHMSRSSTVVHYSQPVFRSDPSGHRVEGIAVDGNQAVGCECGARNQSLKRLADSSRDGLRSGSRCASLKLARHIGFRESNIHRSLARGRTSPYDLRIQ